MDTATKPQAVTHPATVDIDFPARLAIARAGMEALMDHAAGPAREEARQALCGALAAVPEAGELLDPVAGRSPSHPVLAAAGALIRARGWARDVFETPDGAVCALAAIRHVSRFAGEEAAAEAELLSRIAADVGHDAWSVPNWNDRQPDAAAVLRLLY